MLPGSSDVSPRPHFCPPAAQEEDLVHVARTFLTESVRDVCSSIFLIFCSVFGLFKTSFRSDICSIASHIQMCLRSNHRHGGDWKSHPLPLTPTTTTLIIAPANISAITPAQPKDPHLAALWDLEVPGALSDLGVPQDLGALARL
jgi:hypothetical protein